VSVTAVFCGMTNHTHLDPTTSFHQAESRDALLTARRGGPVHRIAKLGRPMAFSTLQKLCALHEGPPVADTGADGRSTAARFEAWVEARGGKTRPVKESQEPQAADGR